MSSYFSLYKKTFIIYQFQTCQRVRFELSNYDKYENISKCICGCFYKYFFILKIY